MMKQHPIWFLAFAGTVATALASCQSLSDHPFGNLFGAGETPSAPCGVAASDSAPVTKLQAENAALKKQLAEAMRDNAMLKDLAAKNW